MSFPSIPLSQHHWKENLTVLTSTVSLLKSMLFLLKGFPVLVGICLWFRALLYLLSKYLMPYYLVLFFLRFMPSVFWGFF